MNNRQIVGLIIILLGLSFLFDFPFFNFFFALFIIYIGVKIMQGKLSELPFATIRKTKSSNDYVNRVLVFSWMKTAYDSKNFKGAEVVIVFGDGEIDLSKVSTKEDRLDINIVAVFGILKVIVPKKWDIKTEGVGIIGTFNNKTTKPSKPKTIVDIEGAAIFGRIDISS